MYVFGFKKTQVWVTVALFSLCCSVCPYSGYPHDEEDMDPVTVEENEDNTEDHELNHDEDEEWEGEDTQEDPEGGRRTKKEPCRELDESCEAKYKGAVAPKCCGDMICSPGGKVCTAKA